MKDYAERFKQTQTVVPDEKERTENVYKYAQEVPYMADFEEISSKEGANTKRRRTEEEAKKYEDLYVKLGFLCGLFILILII